MRKFVIILIIASMSMSSCMEVNDSYLYADVKIRAVPPEGYEMTGFQATLIMQNINSLQYTSSSDFRDGVLSIRILKGVYRLSIGEGGGMSYEKDGQSGFMETVIDYNPVEILEDGQEIEIQLIGK